MKIAVLMSTYNGGRYLAKQLDSLAAQTVSGDMTLYVRDDGSSDDTLSILENYKDRLPIRFLRGKNSGPAMSFWKLLMNEKIEADYYAFCDQDDIWDPDKIERGIRSIESGYVLYACNSRVIDENDKVTRDFRVPESPVIEMPRLFISGVTQGCSMIFGNQLRQALIEKKITCIPMHDIIVMLYALTIGKVQWEQDAHFSYRMHSGNVVAKANKSGIRKLMTTYQNWKNSSRHSMADVARELLENTPDLSGDTREFLENMKGYKTSIRKKTALIRRAEKYDVPSSMMNSFKVRMMLNLL